MDETYAVKMELTLVFRISMEKRNLMKQRVLHIPMFINVFLYGFKLFKYESFDWFKMQRFLNK